VEKQKEWFESWFSSPYYHILYKNRDDNEAVGFIDNIIKYLNPEPSAKILDAACGKGRHSIYLNQKGFDVTGIDLSRPSIASAKNHENTGLSFYTHDIRNIFRIRYFNYIFNLFTSFGYFENKSDNLRCLRAFKKGLTSNGVLLIDFMNAKKAINSMKAHESKVIDDIEFSINKRIEKGFIKKNISFYANGKQNIFEESVQDLGKNDFIDLFNESGLVLMEAFGNYQLDAFNEDSSDRLIMICKVKE